MSQCVLKKLINSMRVSKGILNTLETRSGREIFVPAKIGKNNYQRRHKSYNYIIRNKMTVALTE
jgi:hypothetical protein